MKILLLWAYFLWEASPEPMIVEEIEVPQVERNLNKALPGKIQPAGAMQKVSIEIDAEGKVSAALGDQKLAAFDPGQAGNMKPLEVWLTKVGEKGKPSVTVKVDGNTKQQRVVDFLNVLAKHGITEITFTNLIEK